jgi:hypothetical protein
MTPLQIAVEQEQVKVTHPFSNTMQMQTPRTCSADPHCMMQLPAATSSW